MKTENTLENKVKFFAQYWGQEVLYVPNLIYYGNPPEPSHEEWGKATVNGHWLIKVINSNLPLFLKPLSKISDEDARAIQRGIFDNYINANQFLSDYESIGSIGFLTQKEMDFLRSKGYALPYMDLSIDDLIEYGWIKLEE